MDSFINDFQTQIDGLEKLVIKHEIPKNPLYNKWNSKFNNIYGNKSVDERLYTVLSLLNLLSFYFVNEFILKDDEKVDLQKETIENINEFQEKINNSFISIKIFEFEFFNPLYSLFDNEFLTYISSLAKNVFNYFLSINIPPEYFFDYIIQNFIPSIIRHKTGEFYTPPFLVKKMVKETYKIGDIVLDPCCGTGNFLIEIAKYILSLNIENKTKISALNNLYGFDINPFSLFITKINLLYVLRDLVPQIKLNLFELDTLFYSNEYLKEQFDLVIGNPPWYTYSDIESVDYQKKIKNLANQLEIKPLPKNILNIEISSLFFSQSSKYYLKPNGKIAFVITKGIITGSHAARFRNFKGFKDIKIWMFETNIEKIFNIDFICLFASKTEKFENIIELKIPSFTFTLIKNKDEKLDYFSGAKLELHTQQVLVPYAIEEKNNTQYTKKLIPLEERKNLLHTKPSVYKNLFHKGADLNPRNLIFVVTKDYDEKLKIINPDERIFKKAKEPWTKKEFKDVVIEKDFIFKVIKSTELVKFGIFDSYQTFLPLSNDDLSYNYDNLPQNAKIFYDKINKIYLKNKKATTKNKSLMENLDRWGKLINERQKSNIKVVYNNSGSILSSAVIQGTVLVTGDLSFYATDKLDEAYYLSSVLNSPLMTNQIQIRKSSRHIFKLPFEVNIKKYNPSNEKHKKLAELGLKGHEITKEVILGLSNKKNSQKLSKNKIQALISKRTNNILEQINEILADEFKMIE